MGYLSVSFTFGLQGVKGGLSWWETVLISICNVTSAGQFAGLDIMLSGGGFWIEMACAQFIINLRYALMSISLSQKADKSLSGIHRWLVGFGVTDEIFVMAMGNIGEVSRHVYVWAYRFTCSRLVTGDSYRCGGRKNTS